MKIVIFWGVGLSNCKEKHWGAFLFFMRAIRRAASSAGWQGTLEKKCRSEQILPFLALLGLQRTSWKQEPLFFQHFRISYKPSTVTADWALHLTSHCSTPIFAFFFTLGLHRAWQGGWRQPWARLEMERWESLMQTNWEQLNTSKGRAWLLMAALLRNVVWGFCTLSWAMSFTEWQLCSTV